MFGRFLLLTKLEEVSQELIISKLMTSKKALDPRGIARGLALMDRNARNIAKRKGLRAAVASNTNAIVHLTRHPQIKKVVDIVNVTEPHYQGLPLHPGRW